PLCTAKIKHSSKSCGTTGARRLDRSWRSSPGEKSCTEPHVLCAPSWKPCTEQPSIK
ncbi:hypothetical protein J6590_107816, partial [Homalodisca vitripennis]